MADAYLALDGAHPIHRELWAKQYWEIGNGSTIVPSTQCFCKEWLESRGNNIEKRIANGLQWFAFALSVIILIFYAYRTWRATCGWEEIYVCALELIKVIVEFFHEFDNPAMLYLNTGDRVLWIRYAEWLLTCPVILIHLSNLTGLKDDYSKRTMRLLVSDIGTIVMGATAAMSHGYLKIVFFILGLCYGSQTFFHAAKVYIEAYHIVPKGDCRLIVRMMAWVFFSTWGMYPILFVLGPEGFGHITFFGSTIGHTVVDVLSKNVWGLLGHHLRVKVHEHILLYGDIRKKTKVNIAGEEMEVETLMAEEDEDTVKKPTDKYANRESFLIMRDRLKEKGFEVRASLDQSKGEEQVGVAAATKTAGTSFDPGRVILAVPDISMVDFFRQQFAALPAPIELVPALGIDNTVQLVQQAMNLGGCDFVLMHPEFLRDKTQSGLVSRLKAMNQRTAAFGWAQMGPMRDLIESSGVDGYLEGPSFGSGINQQHLIQLISNMQQAKKMMMGMMGMGMGMMGGGMMGMGGNMMGMGGQMGGNMMGGQMGGGNMMGSQMSNMMAGGNMMGGGMMGSQMGGGMMGSQMGGMAAMQQGNGSARMGTNPLFGSAPSPLSSQPGGMMGGAPQAGGAAAGTSEAEMLQQLMSEINRLKNELGEQH